MGKRRSIHVSGNFFKDAGRFFGFLTKPKKNGRIGRFLSWFSREVRRE